MLPSVMVHADEAKRELARRELARRHLVDFSEYIMRSYHAASHHRLAAWYLEQVETYIRTKGATGIGRLLLLEPPRHGKSEQVSRHFPAWVLGRMPDTRIILASYGADLATKHSRAARDIVLSDRYRAVFGDLASTDSPVQLSEDSRSVQSWDLAAPHRGGMLAAGVGGGITGSGANLFIIDDPVKNREEAESEDRREAIEEWWTSTAYTRLEDGAAVVGMLTRWHGDDWAGKRLKAMVQDLRADRYVVVCLPALWEPIAVPEGKTFEVYQREQMLNGVFVDQEDPLGRKTGQALWPEKYNEDDLARIQVNVGPYDWQALYQQNPYSRVGQFFKRDWFPIVEVMPKKEDVLARIRYWDKAGTKQGGRGDFATGIRMSLTKDKVYYVEHVVRGQWTPGERDRIMLETAELDKKVEGPRVIIWHQQDPGSAGLDSAQATNRMFAGKGFTAHFEVPTGDKEVRAGPWSSQCQGGGVRLVRGGWNDAYIEEHVAFPKGKWDDQVDGSSSAYNKLTTNVLTGQLAF